MKDKIVLTVFSLLSILFFTVHLAGDILRGFEKGGLSNLMAIPTAVLWLVGTLLLAERRSGHIIILLASLLGLLIPVVHMGLGRGLGGPMSKSGEGAFFFIWTVIALGVTSLFSVILSLRGLWRLKRGGPGSVEAS
jgi:hypothetical protein